MNLIQEAQEVVTAEELAKFAEGLPIADETIGERVDILPEPLKKLAAFIQRTLEEVKAEDKRIFDGAVEMVCSSDYPANILEDLAKRLRTRRKLAAQQDVFWAEVRTALKLDENVNLALMKGCDVHYLYPLCSCGQRHEPPAPDSGIVVVEVVRFRPVKRGFLSRLFNW